MAIAKQRKAYWIDLYSCEPEAFTEWKVDSYAARIQISVDSNLQRSGERDLDLGWSLYSFRTVGTVTGLRVVPIIRNIRGGVKLPDGANDTDVLRLLDPYRFNIPERPQNGYDQGCGSGSSEDGSGAAGSVDAGSSGGIEGSSGVVGESSGGVAGSSMFATFSSDDLSSVLDGFDASSLLGIASSDVSTTFVSTPSGDESSDITGSDLFSSGEAPSQGVSSPISGISSDISLDQSSEAAEDSSTGAQGVSGGSQGSSDGLQDSSDAATVSSGADTGSSDVLQDSSGVAGDSSGVAGDSSAAGAGDSSGTSSVESQTVCEILGCTGGGPETLVTSGNVSEAAASSAFLTSAEEHCSSQEQFLCTAVVTDVQEVFSTWFATGYVCCQAPEQFTNLEMAAIVGGVNSSATPTSNPHPIGIETTLTGMTTFVYPINSPLSAMAFLSELPDRCCLVDGVSTITVVGTFGGSPASRVLVYDTVLSDTTFGGKPGYVNPIGGGDAHCTDIASVTVTIDDCVCSSSSEESSA